MGNSLSWGVTVLRIADCVIDEGPGLHEPVSLPAFVGDMFYHGISRGSWQCLGNAAENNDKRAKNFENELNRILGMNDVCFKVSSRFSEASSTIRTAFEYCNFEQEEICLIYEACGYQGEFNDIGTFYGVDVCSGMFGSLIAFGPFYKPDCFERTIARMNQYGLFGDVSEAEAFLKEYPSLAIEHNCEPVENGEKTAVCSIRAITLAEFDTLADREALGIN